MNLSTHTCFYLSQAQLDKQQVVLKRKMDESNSDKIRLKTLLQKKENVAGVKAATAAKVLDVCMCIHTFIYYVYIHTHVCRFIYVFVSYINIYIYSHTCIGMYMPLIMCMFKFVFTHIYTHVGSNNSMCQRYMYM